MCKRKNECEFAPTSVLALKAKAENQLTPGRCPTCGTAAVSGHLGACRNRILRSGMARASARPAGMEELDAVHCWRRDRSRQFVELGDEVNHYPDRQRQGMCDQDRPGAAALGRIARRS